MSAPKIIFIGASSTILVKNILRDVFHRDVLRSAHIVLMDLDPTRPEESHAAVHKLTDSAGVSGRITCYTDQKAALQDADFVAVASQIDGYELCTVTDFTVCKRHGLEQTTADTLGPGGIMHALRTIPHLWQICGDMTEVCPQATMLNYVNSMTMNTRAMYVRYPHIKQAELCHSMQGTAEELTRDLNIDPVSLCYRSTGINHMALYLELERKAADGAYVNLYPELLTAYESSQAPKPNIHKDTRRQNIVRYEIFKKLGYLVTESSEHFAGYMPWFTKPGREDPIKCYKVPLDEYPKRRVEQLANRREELEEYKVAEQIDIKPSREYASTIMNAIWTSEPNVVYDNVRNNNLIDNLPQGCCVEVACLVDANDIQPTKIGTLPSHLVAMMQTNTNVQILLAETILTENHDHVYHATMMGLHIVAVLGIEEIYALADDLIASHGDWLPAWLHR